MISELPGSDRCRTYYGMTVESATNTTMQYKTFSKNGIEWSYIQLENCFIIHLYKRKELTPKQIYQRKDMECQSPSLRRKKKYACIYSVPSLA